MPQMMRAEYDSQADALASWCWRSRRGRLHDARVDHVADGVLGRGRVRMPSRLRALTAAGELALVLDVLRRTLRRAIEDPGFRHRFADDADVRASWPLA